MNVFWKLFLSLASIVAVFGVLVTLLVLWSYTTYGDIRSGWLRMSGCQLIAEQYQIDLRTVSAGENKSGTFRLKNLTSKPVTLLGIETDCSCLATTELPATIFGNVEFDFEVVLRADNVDSERQIVRQMILNTSVDQPIQILAVKVVVIPNKKEN